MDQSHMLLSYLIL